MKYFIDNKIGEPGGFGDVYDCHSELGDRYAIKMLKTDEILSDNIYYYDRLQREFFGLF